MACDSRQNYWKVIGQSMHHYQTCKVCSNHGGNNAQVTLQLVKKHCWDSTILPVPKFSISLGCNLVKVVKIKNSYLNFSDDLVWCSYEANLLKSGQDLDIYNIGLWYWQQFYVVFSLNKIVFVLWIQRIIFINFIFTRDQEKLPITYQAILLSF